MTLNEKILSYQNGSLEFLPLRDEITLSAYRYLRKSRYAFSDDEIGDCLCVLLEMLPQLLKRYKVSEIPFEVYLYKTCKLSVFSSRRSRMTAARKAVTGEYLIREDHELFAEEPQIELNETENSFLLFLKETLSRILKKYRPTDYVYRLSLLIILLKSGHNLTEQEKAAICRWGQFDRETTDNWLAELYSSTEQARKTINIYEMRRNRYASFAYNPNFSPASKKLNYHIISERLERWNQKLNSIRTSPKNSRIAAILGIDRLFIDTLFAKIKRDQKRWSRSD